MIYKNCLGGFEYNASMHDFTPPFTEFEPRYEEVASSKGKRVEKNVAHLSVGFMGEGFDLSNKQYFYESESEYFQAVDRLIEDMSDRGFEVSYKKQGTIRSPRKMTVKFVHTATKKAAEESRLAQEKKYTEKGYVRFGDVPKGGKSYNYRDNFYEQGVSVFHAMFSADGDYIIKSQNGVQFFGMYAYANRPAYRVFGKEIGVGSDGEPILEVQRAIKIEQLKKQAVEDKGEKSQSHKDKRDPSEQREKQIAMLGVVCNKKLSDEIVKDQIGNKESDVPSKRQVHEAKQFRAVETKSDEKSESSADFCATEERGSSAAEMSEKGVEAAKERLKEMSPVYQLEVASGGKEIADAKFDKAFKSKAPKAHSSDRVQRSDKSRQRKKQIGKGKSNGKA